MSGMAAAAPGTNGNGQARERKPPGHRRGAAPPEMPAEHALLGLITLTGGEAHGYELARHFDPAHPLGLGEILRLEQSMLYQHLKKLERQGWLTVSLQPQGTRPPRQMYRLTEAGRAELRRWLAEPVARTREIRLEFLVKLFFALQLDRDRAARLIADQEDVSRGIAADLEAQLASLAGRAGDDPAATTELTFRRMVLELRLDQTRAVTAWLNAISGTRGAARA
jgi:PadR family transcriptional regulator AphA